MHIHVHFCFLLTLHVVRKQAKELSLPVIKSMIMEHRPLPSITSAMDVVTASYAQTLRPPAGTGGSGDQPTQACKSPAGASGGITSSAGPRGVFVGIRGQFSYLNSFLEKCRRCVEVCSCWNMSHTSHFPFPGLVTTDSCS